MKTLVSVLLVVALALLGARRSLLGRRIPLGVRHWFQSGLVFLFIGLLLGERGAGILDGRLLSGFAPCVSFALGWLGLLFGLQLDARRLRALPHAYLRMALAEAAVTFAICATVFHAWLPWFGAFSPLERLAVSVVLGAASACTAPSGLAVVARFIPAESRNLLALLRYQSSLDAVVGVVLLGALLLFFGGALRSGEAVSIHPLITTGLTLGLAGTVALVFRSLTAGKFSSEELLFFLIGLLTFAAGVSLAFDLSPLFVCFLAGVLLANVSPDAPRVLERLAGAERPVFLLLLLLAGAAWAPSGWVLPALGIAAALVRGASKALGGFVVTRAWRPEFPVPVGVGLALVSQGGMSLAIAINYQEVVGPQRAAVVMTVVIVSAVLSEVASPALSVAQLAAPARPRRELAP